MDGYQRYRSPDLVVVDTPVEHNMYLTPIVEKASDATVLVDDDGFSPSVLMVEPGQVIEWVNVGSAGHTVAAGAGSGVAGQAGGKSWNSGLLVSGDSYKRQFDSEGTFTLADPNNPALTVIVAAGSAEPDPDTDPQDENVTLFVPMVIK